MIISRYLWKYKNRDIFIYPENMEENDENLFGNRRSRFYRL